MWTNTLKGALGNVKDAWSTIEQSLDAAVGQPSEVEPITIPPPTGSLSTLMSSSSSSSSSGGGGATTSHKSSWEGQGTSGDFFQSFLDRSSRSSTPLVPSKSPRGLLGRLLGDSDGQEPQEEEEEEEEEESTAASEAPQDGATGAAQASGGPTAATTETSSPRRAQQQLSSSVPASPVPPTAAVDSNLSSSLSPPPSSPSARAPGSASPPVLGALLSPAKKADSREPIPSPQRIPPSWPGAAPHDDDDDDNHDDEREQEDPRVHVVEAQASSAGSDDVADTVPAVGVVLPDGAMPAASSGDGMVASVPPLQGQDEEEEPAQEDEEEEEKEEGDKEVVSVVPAALPTPPLVMESPRPLAPDSVAVKELVAEVRGQYEGQVKRLESMLRESENRCGLLETELRKAKTIFQSDDAKQRQITALIEEGKALAFKQSEMEKAVRKARGDLKGVEQERNTLQQDKEALELKTKSMTELVKKKEQENSSLTQSLAAVQAVNQASSDKLAKVEAELSRARDEVSSQKVALEKAWGEEKELKRMITDMTAEHGSLLNQLDDDKALAKGLEGIKQDFEQRESLLQSTNKTLQEALTRATHEAGLREDTLRQEVTDMRKRWQDAVSRTETLAADMHESTAPLLRQIKALQEEARVRSTAWNSAEEALTERARSAESLARTAEEAKATALRKAETLELRVADLDSQIRCLTMTLQETTAALKSAESGEHEAKARISALEQEVVETRDWAKRTVKESKAMEAKLKLQLQDVKEAVGAVKADHDDDRAKLMLQVDSLRKELGEERKRASSSSAGLLQYHHSNNSSMSSSPYNSMPGMYSSPRPVANEAMTQSSILERTIAGSVSESGRGNSFTFSGGNGEVSVLAVEKLQQTLRQREEEVAHLQDRLMDVERTRDALTQEMAAMGKKTSMLQASAQAVKTLRQQVAELSKKNDVLLELLGEKTEEYEALQEELGNLKAHFRRQLDELLQEQQQQQQPQQQKEHTNTTVAH